MSNRSFTVDEPSSAGMRIDKFIAEVARLFSRSQLKQRVTEIRIDGKPAKLSHRLSLGEKLEIDYREESPPAVEAEPIELAILYEDEHVIVVDKPQGMVVHPAAGNYSGTLVQGLAYHCLQLGERLGRSDLRPGIVHRLDKDTSGVLIAAKSATAQELLAHQFRRRSTEKLYLAIVKGRPVPPSGSIKGFIRRDPLHRKRFETSNKEGRLAETDYLVLRQWERHALVRLRPRTGRTHQLRVHLASLGHPVVGDPVYGRPDADFPGASLMLHAFKLSIVIPAPGEEGHLSRGERLTFRAPLPERFKRLLRDLAGKR